MSDFNSTRPKTSDTVTYEPPRGKTNSVVFERVRHELACTATEAG